MSITINESNSTETSMQDDSYWQTGRVVVYTSGTDAGLMRLDMDIPGVDTAEEAKQTVKLLVPGELSPLDALSAVGEDGRFIISYFSSDIANAGHLPADAAVYWNLDGNQQRRPHVEVVAARRVERADGRQAARIPGGRPADMYPQTVGLLAVVTVAFLMICAAAFLAIG